MSFGKWVLLGSLAGALVIVGCGGPKSGVSKENKAYRKETKGAPKWVVGDLNDVKKSDKNYSSVFLGRGQSEIVQGDVEYATDQATMKAKANLASKLASQMTKEQQEQKTRNGNAISVSSGRDISEKVSRELVATKTLATWVGKDRVWVLVGLDDSVVDKIRAELGMSSK